MGGKSMRLEVSPLKDQQNRPIFSFADERQTHQVESLKSVVDRFPKMFMKSWVVHEKETQHLLSLGGHESKPRWRAHNPHPQGDSEKKTSHDKR